jgi:hypothetical protein
MDDQEAAGVQGRARERLMARGGRDLPRLPWLAAGQPHDAVTLIRQALWRADADREDLRAALALLAAGRAELDQMEAGLLFTARAQGLTWTQIADALGLHSAQAAQQRHERVVARLDAGGGP